MDKMQFWQLIEASRAGLSGDDICDEQGENLKALLLKLSAQEIIQFDNIFSEFAVAAYRWDLWAAAYIINGGASDDGFTYFRWWLIAQGQNYYEAALKDVESAGDNATPGEDNAECEAVCYCINEAHREKTGTDLPTSGEGGSELPAEPTGYNWREEDLSKLYPRLCEKFG